GECDETYRGREGSLTVTTMDWQDPLCEAFMAGAMSLGIPRNPDYNGAIQEGVSYCQRTIENGLRMSAAKAFLHPARKRGNVDVRTHAHVTNLIFEGKRAVGVRYLKGGKGGTPVELRASKEVILSVGTYSSDLQLTFTPASYKEGVQGQLEDEPGMTVASWQQRPESRGYVRIRSADPFAPPIIQTNYLVEEIDRRVVVAGMKLARRLLS